MKLSVEIQYEKSILTTIQARRSVRTYSLKPIPAADKETLLEAASALSDERQRFAWSAYEPGNRFAERLGTYGFIKGAHAFLVGILPRGAKHERASAARFGYSFEQLILKATELGLGTCWLGGTFNPLLFAADARLKLNEHIVIASPIGYPADESNLIHDISVQVVRSRHRKDWDGMFFTRDFKQPLSKKAAGKYAQPLEMVRQSPSAVNTQPWRVLQDDQGFHFFGAKTRYYGVKKVNFLRDNDIGIAMSHFALACSELGLAGGWEQIEPAAETNGLTYFASWTTGE